MGDPSTPNGRILITRTQNKVPRIFGNSHISHQILIGLPLLNPGTTDSDCAGSGCTSALRQETGSARGREAQPAEFRSNAQGWRVWEFEGLGVSGLRHLIFLANLAEFRLPLGV